MQVYWNKRKRSHKKRVQLPEDWLGTPTLTPTWPPFYCFGTPIWPLAMPSPSLFSSYLYPAFLISFNTMYCMRASLMFQKR